MPRAKKALGFDILGIEEITSYFIELGKVPQKSVKKAARAGATVIKRGVLASPQLPVRQGFLKMSIMLKEENKRAGKRNLSGKAGFDVMFNPAYNAIFNGKKIKRPGLYGATPPKPFGYYPASMEYGFKTAKGGVGGHYFMKSAAMAEESKAQDKMIEVLSKDIDAIEKKKG